MKKILTILAVMMLGGGAMAASSPFCFVQQSSSTQATAITGMYGATLPIPATNRTAFPVVNMASVVCLGSLRYRDTTQLEYMDGRLGEIYIWTNNISSNTQYQLWTNTKAIYGL